MIYRYACACGHLVGYLTEADPPEFLPYFCAQQLHVLAEGSDSLASTRCPSQSITLVNELPLELYPLEDA